NVYVSNPLITRCQINGIQIQDGNLTVMGGDIRKIGYFDQTFPWPTCGIYAGENTSSLIVNGTTINSEGYGLYTMAVFSQLSGVYTKDCSNGGQGGTVNSSTGVSAIVFAPQSTDRYFQMTNCVLYNSSGVGKTGLLIGSDAVPAAGNIKLTNNNIAL